jgi:hypothetical protein
MPQKGVKDHKELVKKVLFSQEFYDEKDGKSYPKNRIVANLVDYSGQYLDRNNEYQDYKGKKVTIINTKLVLKSDNIEAKKKVVYIG